MCIIYLCYLHYYLLHIVTQTDQSVGGLTPSNVGLDPPLQLLSTGRDVQTEGQYPTTKQVQQTPLVSKHPKPSQPGPNTHSVLIPPMTNKSVSKTKQSLYTIVLQTKQMGLQPSWICQTCGKQNVAGRKTCPKPCGKLRNRKRGPYKKKGQPKIIKPNTIYMY